MAFLDEIYPEIENEVRRQLDYMTELDDRDEPNFADTDYQLAAYAAALRVLTQYGDIEAGIFDMSFSGSGSPAKKQRLKRSLSGPLKLHPTILFPRESTAGTGKAFQRRKGSI